MTRNLSFDDYIALGYVAGGEVATHHVARTLGYGRVSGHRATARARILLRRLERWGYVSGERGVVGGNVRWWKITDAGQQALA